ncbi:hypothetical protein HanPSC8_Chr12g0508261 [Helianthus annuus]|nr:hypothetical protein HanPSC8_Chr12g0508261 [Helianthus annuus]
MCQSNPVGEIDLKILRASASKVGPPPLITDCILVLLLLTKRRVLMLLLW